MLLLIHGRRKKRRSWDVAPHAGDLAPAWSLPRREEEGVVAAGMVDRTADVVIGVTAGVAAAVAAAALVLLAICLYRRRRASASVAAPARSPESSTATLRANGSLNSSVSLSVASDWDHHPPPAKHAAAFWAWRGGANNGSHSPPPVSVSGIPKYHYK